MMPAGAHTDAEITVPRLVEVWAPWCSACKAMEDDLLAVADRFDGSVKLERVNAADQPDVVDQLGVMGTPTLIGFSGGAASVIPQENSMERQVARFISSPCEYVCDRSTQVSYST